jgi:hypothetical protein
LIAVRGNRAAVFYASIMLRCTIDGRDTTKEGINAINA